MRTLPARATLSSELLWWDLLIDTSQCWGNRLKKSFWESLVRTAHPVKNDALPCRQVQDLGSANHFVDDENVVGKISRISDATCTTFRERLRKLFPEVHGGLANIFGFAPVHERSMNSGVESSIFASSISADLYSRSDVREHVELVKKMPEQGVRHNKVTLLSMLRACGHGQCLERNGTSCSLGQTAALCTQRKSVLEAASKLASAFAEICVKHGGLEEASFVIDNIHKQLSFIMDGAGIMQKGSSDFSAVVDKVDFLTHFSWMEQVGSKTDDNIYLSILKPFGGIGLVKFAMLLHNHVISNDLEGSVCFWSALADLYVEGGMPMDAHRVLKSLEDSLAVPFRAWIEGCALPGECSNRMQHEGEQPNDSMHSGLLPCIHNGRLAEGHCAFQGSKHFMMRTYFSQSCACLKEINVLRRSTPSTSFSRPLSTSTEKQCDEDVGEQQSSSQHQNSSQQQSSLEVPESKPQSTSSWPNPDNAASYVLMSNIYADGDRWDEVKRINEMRLKARAWKKPGKAYVEIKAKVHEFIVGDRTHQDSVNIYEKLRKIKRHMGHIGYVPNVDLILENRSYYDPYARR